MLKPILKTLCMRLSILQLGKLVSQYAVILPSVLPIGPTSCVIIRIRTLLRRSTLATPCCGSLTMVRWIPWPGTSTSVRTRVAGTAPSVASCFVSTFWFTRDTSWPSRFTATGTDLVVTLSFTRAYASLFLDILLGFPRKNVGVSYLNMYLLFIHGLLKNFLRFRLCSTEWQNSKWIMDCNGYGRRGCGLIRGDVLGSSGETEENQEK
jgi:hypothetical protein